MFANNVNIKATWVKPARLLDYGGEFIDVSGETIEVEILQFVKSFFGSKAICRVGNVFQEVPIDELKYSDLSLDEINKETQP